MAVISNGTTIITGGSLTDGIVVAGDLASNSVTSAKIASSAVTDAKISGMSSSKLSGALPAIDGSALTNLPGGGKILQVLTASDSTERTTTSTSFTNASTTLSVSITPSATSSKIFVVASIGGYKKDGGAIYLSIFRGSTNLGDANRGMINGDANNVMYSSAMTVLDSPSTTSSTTYEVRMRSAGGDTVRLNADYVESNIVVMEVSA